MNEKLRTLAFIPARGGSKGVPRKNIVDLGGIPLIAWSIKAALEAKHVDRVIVSTDDEEIAAISRTWGAEVPFLRPAELAGDSSSLHDVANHLLEYLKSNGDDCSILLTLFPTSPFRTPALIDQIAYACKTSCYTCVTVAAHNFNPGLWISVDGDTGRPIDSPQSGAFCQKLGNVVGRAERLYGKDSKNDYEDKQLFIRDLIQGNDRLRGTGNVIPIHNPALLTDINTIQDLQKARSLFEQDAIPWHPVSGYHTQGGFGENALFEHSSDKDILSLKVALSRPVEKTSEMFTEIALSSIGTPYELRKKIDESPFFKGEAVRISQYSNTSIFSELKPTEPTLMLNEGQPLNVNSGASWAILANAWLLFDRGYQSEFGHYLKFITSRAFQEEAQDWSIQIEGSRAILSLNAAPDDGLELWLSLVDREGNPILTESNYVLLKFRYENSTWLHVGSTGNESRLSFVSQQDNAIMTLSFDVPSETSWAHACFVRKKFPASDESWLLEEVTVPKLISFRTDHESSGWHNEQTGSLIVGRQQLPQIFRWSEVAYLPAVVKESDVWKVFFKPR